MNTSVKTPKTLPHHRLSLKDVIRDFKAGLLTVRGAIFYLVASARKIGKAVRVSVSWVCKQLGISKASYYRAIGQLSDQHRLKISAPDEMELTIPTSTTEGSPDYIFLDELSQICDSQSQIGDSDSQIGDSDSHICDSQSQICDKKTPQPKQGNGSEIPLSSLSLQSDQSLSSALQNRERETKKTDESLIKSEEQEKFREWLGEKGDRLPNPPVLREQWIASQVKVRENQLEFLREKEKREQAKRSAPPLNFEQIEFACNSSISQGDSWAVRRLQDLLDEGLSREVEHLLTNNPHWHLSIEGDQVVEGES